MVRSDVVIIGAGIVGLATAYRLLERFPKAVITVLDKEREIAQHQTGHNSGVLHTGIYYKPGTMRAINAREGKLLLEQFCDQHDIPYECCGKVIVATQEAELPQLDKLFERAMANGVRAEKITAERLREIEPYASGVAALHVPEAGIIDYRQVCDKMAEMIRQQGNTILTSARVYGMYRDGNYMVVETTRGPVEGKTVINCGGLQSDRLTWLSGQMPPAQIVPFRGEYFELKPSAHKLCRGLIYPVPDPNFPFLGVHLTRMIHGGVECGPNAVLAFSREGYHKTSFNPYDLFETITYRGFLLLMLRNWDEGLRELWRSLSKKAFVTALQKLVPDINSDDLIPAPAGVRAQALLPTGELADDFLIQERDLVVNVCNAPSPAATASLKIGDFVVDQIANRLAS
ncbi:FAD dependent oxidoreductase [Planctopirus limnophila DSM 3776]|uniref:FAD dependent oxidoreductase n=1 Tax=Planctopirus limnophila (strain ATCC 43296 / DSM 3776 / IFAM 1008 / Mu 290) TaxID=521674 RepID=D5SUV0_PLAL2|nr:L-2-hydroxyglutarate oxidase [Planctopirus limnophila]ADG69236.1 FAD dependent oxidoreductase [Planctopirus limnophila DSM 3776]